MKFYSENLLGGSFILGYSSDLILNWEENLYMGPALSTSGYGSLISNCSIMSLN